MDAIYFNYTFFIQLVNFIVTIVLLNFLLIRPVRDQIAKRKALTDGYLADIEKFSYQAEKELSTYEAALDVARTNATADRDSLRAEGHKQEQDILAETQKEAQNLIQVAREKTVEEAKKSLAVLQKQVPALAEQVVSKILQ